MTAGTRQNLSFSTPVLLLIVTAMLSTPSAWAAHPLITEDAYTLGEGVAQIEIGVEHARFDQSDVQGRVNNLRLTLSYGARENVDRKLFVWTTLADARAYMACPPCGSRVHDPDRQHQP